MPKSFSNNSLLDFYRWQDAPWQKSFNLLKQINPSSFLQKATASLCIIGIFLINVPVFNAYEAHVLGVTSHIKNPIADHLVINKVYYDVDAAHGTEKDNEWIELYNPTDENVNIRDWQICDNKVCVYLSLTDLTIPPGGFAVLSRSATTWSYWYISDNVLKIVLTNPSLFYLSNVSDMLLLKDNSESIVDQMNWGTPAESWINYNDNLWNPGCLDVPEGHLLGRFPNGYDTNKASNFKDFAPPTVSVIYPSGGSLYGGQSINIKWQAANPNGPDDDLAINIVYITDNDKNGAITPGDNLHLIADNIANTGTFNWTISPCYYGYIWIKIIAIGPENFMINNSAVSPPVFEPPTPDNSSASDTSSDTLSDTSEELNVLPKSSQELKEETGQKGETGQDDSSYDIPSLPLETDTETSKETTDNNQNQQTNDTEELGKEESQETKLIPPDNPPEAPKGLTVKYKEGKAFLNWDANQEKDLAGYNIYRKRKCASYEKINTFLVKTSEYIDSNIEAGELYYYQIKAVDEAGQESEASIEVKVNIPKAKPEFVKEAPREPDQANDNDSELNAK